MIRQQSKVERRGKEGGGWESGSEGRAWGKEEQLKQKLVGVRIVQLPTGHLSSRSTAALLLQSPSAVAAA